MKKILILITCILFSGILKAQNERVITLPSSGSAVRYANVNSNASVDTTSAELDAMVWTGGVSHVYLQFDLSQMPANAIVDSAYLNLYADASAGNGNAGSPTYGTNNACGIYQVTGNWSGSAITWAAQPTYTSANSVTLPQSTAATEDYTGIDVSALVKNMKSGNNYGFLIKPLQETTASNSMIFYSPHAAVAGKQPSLAICYHLSQ
jgi:hypothetical protein